MQPTLFDKQEVAKAHQVLDAMELSRGEYLDRIREKLAVLYRSRWVSQGLEAFVSADDARDILNKMPNVPPPSRMNRNFLGQLFRADGWKFTGKTINSKTPGSHGNLLRCWRWVGQ
ncbi:MAG: hypothetical protein JKX85_10125 [Phycisphaeraceae bacterium]|nr:hypothetical protein [Phycisphaeraceae bacterium]